MIEEVERPQARSRSSSTKTSASSPAQQLLRRLSQRLAPEGGERGEVPLHSIAIARILYGAVMVYSLTRFALSGWVEELWVRPSFFFKYEWAGWMPAWEPAGLYLHLGLTLTAALCVTLGLYTRRALLIFVVGFTGLQLIDKVNYLNHYYLAICFAFPLILSPSGSALSLDCRWRGEPRLTQAPAWSLALLRFQLAIVYLFAAHAKLGSDWLCYAQPLSIWLSSRGDLPLIGPWLTLPETAYVMSWAGFIYDLTIVFFLYWRSARPWAYAVVLLFHLGTWALFDIGIFPIIMTSLTPLFFHPRWPERLGIKLTERSKDPPHTFNAGRSPSTSFAVLILGWVGFHLLFPLRAYLLDEEVLWSERGMRYSWRVMVREKMGSLTYRVQPLESDRSWEVNPRRYLEPRQLSEMSGQPDMIVELAHWVRQRAEAKLHRPVAVYADAWVSLNGRPPQRLINPTLDLTRVSVDHPLLILPPPQTPPLIPR